jgi:D-lactate dehydrogenase
LGRGFPAICIFVSDDCSLPVVEDLARHGLRLIALRCAGFNNVDRAACQAHGIQIARVPSYSPHAVAEHALCMLLAVNRKIHRAYQRVREHNFSLDGLVGFDIYGKRAGIVGTGRIGQVFGRAMAGLGAEVVGYDPYPNPCFSDALGFPYVALDELLRTSDIVSLHCPLTVDTKHMIGESQVAMMKPGVTLINTSRGGLVDTRALIEGLKSGRIGGAGLDVYEEEDGVFFEDLSGTVLQDDVLARLLTFPNVVVTSHQAFLTREALQEIAATTLKNISEFEAGRLTKEVIVG